MKTRYIIKIVIAIGVILIFSIIFLSAKEPSTYREIVQAENYNSSDIDSMINYNNQLLYNSSSELSNTDSYTSSDNDSSIADSSEIDSDIDSSKEDIIEDSSLVDNSDSSSIDDNSVVDEIEDENWITYYYYDDWLWVGHSRIVGMAGSVPMTYLAKSGMGLDWIQENYEELCSFRNHTIVFNFGINDYWNVYNYANFYNNLPEEFIENNCIYVITENPVDEVKQYSYGYSSKNSTIEWFNENLRINLRDEIYFLDTYHYLMEDGFDTLDGIHYDHNTNIKIYNYIVNTIKGT